mgnify:CR=1 FL=1
MSAAQRLDKVFGLPRGSAVIVRNDPETKVPIAIMDGTLISAIRTGAVTGVCAKYMASSRSKTVGLFGAGPQCKTQLMALKASLPQLEKAYVYDLSRERAEKFAAEMSQKLNMDVQAASDRLATIESGDILVTATTATEPIIHGAEIKKGVYVAHLGNNEVDEELILRADKVVIDDWETDKHRMGDTMAYMFRDGKIDDSGIDASVSDLVAGGSPAATTTTSSPTPATSASAFTTWRSPRASTSMPRKTASARSSSSGTSPSWCDRSKLDRYDLSLPTFWTGLLFSGPVHIFSRQSSRGDAPAKGILPLQRTIP